MVSPYMMKLFKEAAKNGIFCQYTDEELETPAQRQARLTGKQCNEPEAKPGEILGLRPNRPDDDAQIASGRIR